MPTTKASARLLPALFASLASCCLGPAQAKEVKLPSAKPKVVMDVPDDWSVTPWSDGLEMRSADGDVLMVIGLGKPGKAQVQAWQKVATERLKVLGVAFDPKAKAPAKVAIKPAATDSKAPADSKAPVENKPTSAAKLAETSQIAPSNTAEAMFGTPSLGIPQHAPTAETALEDKKMAGLSLEELTGKTPFASGPQFRFRTAVLYGATIGGKPVDAQFFDFAIDSTTALLMQQASPSTDERVGAVVNSLRAAKP